MGFAPDLRSTAPVLRRHPRYWCDMRVSGIGVDMVTISRVADLLERYGDRFARRILTDAELAEIETHSRPERFLAKRFAAKEAAAKAFGTGFRDGLWFRHIGVTHDATGRPTLDYTGPAQTLARQRGVIASHLSISDEADLAIAFVTLVGD